MDKVALALIVILASCDDSPQRKQVAASAKIQAKSKVKVKSSPSVPRQIPIAKHKTPHRGPARAPVPRQIPIAKHNTPHRGLADAPEDAVDLENKIRQAAPGDTIQLRTTTYILSQPIVLTKPITLIGRGMFRTTMKASGLASVLDIRPSASGTKVKGIAFSGAYAGIRASGQSQDARVRDVEVHNCRFIDNDVGVSLKWTIAEVHHNLFVGNRKRGITMASAAGKIAFNTIVDTYESPKEPGWGIKGSLIGDVGVNNNLIGNTQSSMTNAIDVFGFTFGYRDNVAFGKFSGPDGAFRHHASIRTGLASIHDSNQSYPHIPFSDAYHYVPFSADLPHAGYRKPGSAVDPRDIPNPGWLEQVPLRAVVQGQTLTFTVNAQVSSAKFQLGSAPPGVKLNSVARPDNTGFDVAVEWKPDINLPPGDYAIEVIATPQEAFEHWKLSTTINVELKTSCQNGEVEPWEDCEVGECCHAETCRFVPGGSETTPATECGEKGISCNKREVCTGTSAECPEWAQTCQVDLGDPVDGPVVLETFPHHGNTLAGEDPRAIWVYASDGHGVKSVTLTDGLGNDVTSTVKRLPSGVELPISTAVHGQQDYTLALDDRSHRLSFFVDAIPPVTTVSHDSGVYATQSLTVQWASGEPVTLHYSLDGDVPSAGAQNTHTTQITAENPVTRVFTEDTVVRWYSVDAANNREAERKRVFLFRQVASETTAWAVEWVPPVVRVSWQPLDTSEDAQVRVYRATNGRDISLLRASREGMYPPPSALRLGQVAAAASGYGDSTPYYGAQVFYGITVVKNGKESVISPLQAVAISPRAVTAAPSDPESARHQAIEFAVLWLETSQNDNGSWGRKRSMVATAQVLDGLFAANRNSRSGRRALSYLRSRKIADNDSLARAINTLGRYGQDVEAKRVRLLARAHLDGTKVVGWGVDNHYHADPVTTALGLRATNAPLVNAWQMGAAWPKDNNRPGWTQSSPPSVAVTAEMARGFPQDFLWRMASVAHAWTGQNLQTDSPGYGSFHGRIQETALALLGFEDLTDDRRVAARQWLIGQQRGDGSWGGDPFLTGLVVEALAEANTPITATETIVGVTGTGSSRSIATPSAWKSSVPADFVGHWELVDGPAHGLAIANANQLDTDFTITRSGSYRLRLVGTAQSQPVFQDYQLEVTDGPNIVRPRRNHYELPLIGTEAILELRYALLDKKGGIPKTYVATEHEGVAPVFSRKPRPGQEHSWSATLADAPKETLVKFSKVGTYVIELRTVKGSEKHRNKVEETHRITVEVIAPLTGLALHWTFDELADNRVEDHSEIGNQRGNVSPGVHLGWAGREKYAYFREGGAIRYDWPENSPDYPRYTVALWARADGTLPEKVETRNMLYFADLMQWRYTTHHDLVRYVTVEAGFPDSNRANLIPTHWNHYVIRYNGDTVDVVVNGVLLKQFNTDAEHRAKLTTLLLGATDKYVDDSYVGSPFVGGIDDVRIYNRALTLEEIEMLQALSPLATNRTAR